MIARPLAATPTARHRADSPVICLAETKARRRWLEAQRRLRDRDLPQPEAERTTGTDPQPAA